jgi:hypothetical protein
LLIQRGSLSRIQSIGLAKVEKQDTRKGQDAGLLIQRGSLSRIKGISLAKVESKTQDKDRRQGC